MARISQDDLSFDKSKFDSTKPRVLISIDIQEEKNAGNDLQEDCSKRKNYCRHNQGWQIQQPFYVEEPTWVDTDIDYIDSSQRVDNGDPYILTRGKKIYRIKDQEQVSKSIEDYEATLGYPSNKKLLIKNRVRRSAKTNDGFQDKTADIKSNQIKERNYYDFQDVNRDINNTVIMETESRGEKSSKIDKISEEVEKPKNISDVFIKKYENLKNLAKKSLRGFKFTKQNKIFTNGIIKDSIEQKQKIQREDIPNDIENNSSKPGKIERFNNSKSHFATNINKRNKRLVLLKSQELGTRKKREIYEIDTNSKKDVKKNETYEEMKTKVYVNKLNNPVTPDNLFILSRNKDPFYNEIGSLNKKDHNKSIEKTWKLYYTHRKKLESETEAKNEEDRFEINKDNIRITDSQLTNEFNSKNSEIKTSNYREKRNACKTCQIKLQLQQDEWLKDFEKKIQSLSLERRDKHRDILERLREPYIIARGKKAPRDFRKDIISSMSNLRDMDEDRAKIISLPVVESFPRMLLMETLSRCDNDNCDINVNQLSERLSPRDRRGTLDEILAAYDPYYVARGKRMNRDEKSVSFEMGMQDNRP